MCTSLSFTIQHGVIVAQIATPPIATRHNTQTPIHICMHARARARAHTHTATQPSNHDHGRDHPRARLLYENTRSTWGLKKHENICLEMTTCSRLKN
mmetsp:Transcript_47003/g.77785  ORF Transcript_47003/g.77785 Transcript_47003/m.77785 type:complete len:97 (+) Transcript_47003:314-604(+)